MTLFRPNNFLYLLPAILVVLLAPLIASAAIYKWTDENGNTVYSELPPPPGAKAQRIKGSPPPPVDPNEAMTQLREQAEAFSQRREDRLTVAKEGKEALEKKKKNEKICAQLRENLQIMETHTKLTETAEGKEPVAMTEEQRQKRIKDTKDRIQKECSGN